MKVHAVTQSYSEVKTYNILDRTLSKHGYKILSSVRLCDVLKLESGEKLNEFEDAMYRYGHFDFLVCGRKGDTPLWPVFAVEFDGPQHENDPIQKRRDEYKNRFCKDSGFKMLRITDEQLEEHEKISILKFMLMRYIVWQKEHTKIMNEIGQTIAELGPDHPILVEMRETGVCDPLLDPTFIFDIKYPFPPLVNITHRLANRKIFTLRTTKQMVEYQKEVKPPFVYFCELALSNFNGNPESVRWFNSQECYLTKRRGDPKRITYTQNGVETDPPGLFEIIYMINKKVSLKWGVSTGRDLGEFPSFGKIKDLYFCDLPGVHIPDIAEQLSEYLCLREIEKWAEKNLPEIK